MNDLQALFPAGKYWNHPNLPNDPSSVTETACNHHPNCNTSNGSCGCNYFGNGIQCFGFAKYMAYRVFGTFPDTRNWDKKSGDGRNCGGGWEIYHGDYLDDAFPLEPGDLIRTETHSALVHTVSDAESADNRIVTTAEVYGSLNCKIGWGKFNNNVGVSEADIRAIASYIVKAPKPINVTFVFRDGDNEKVERDVYPEATYEFVPSPTFPHEFETFIGWWDDPTIQNKEYNGNSIVTATTDHTLYAHWASTFEIMNVGANKALTISGSNVTSLTNNQNVILSDYSGADTQKWLAKSLGTQRVVKSVIDINFGLNIYAPNSTKNCDVYPTCGNEGDALVDFVLQSDGTLKIKMRKYNLYLTAVSTGEGENLQWNVMWQAASDSNLQKWTATIL